MKYHPPEENQKFDWYGFLFIWDPPQSYSIPKDQFSDLEWNVYGLSYVRFNRASEAYLETFVLGVSKVYIATLWYVDVRSVPKVYLMTFDLCIHKCYSMLFILDSEISSSFFLLFILVLQEYFSSCFHLSW